MLAAGLLFAAAGDPLGFLDVTVTNVHNGNGHVLVAICLPEQFLSRHCQYAASVPARAGSVVVRINGILPRTYAVQVFQDENDNLKIDRNFFGLPTEGIGFSNNAVFRFGPPRFADAAVALGTGGEQISVQLRYFG